MEPTANLEGRIFAIPCDLKSTCIQAYGWTENFADQAINGYRQFLKLKYQHESYDDASVSPESLVFLPSPTVEHVWKQHVLKHMGHYLKACQDYCGTAIVYKSNHDDDKDDDDESRKTCIKHTTFALKSLFGRDINTNVWSFESEKEAVTTSFLKDYSLLSKGDALGNTTPVVFFKENVAKVDDKEDDIHDIRNDDSNFSKPFSNSSMSKVDNVPKLVDTDSGEQPKSTTQSGSSSKSENTAKATAPVKTMANAAVENATSLLISMANLAINAIKSSASSSTAVVNPTMLQSEPVSSTASGINEQVYPDDYENVPSEIASCEFDPYEIVIIKLRVEGGSILEFKMYRCMPFSNVMETYSQHSGICLEDLCFLLEGERVEHFYTAHQVCRAMEQCGDNYAVDVFQKGLQYHEHNLH